jgi:5-deoxy-D-glucuronate isomerase
MSPETNALAQGIIFRKTNAHTGRRIAVNPANSAMHHLSYGRIVLNHHESSAAFSTQECETGLICLSGEAVVAVGAMETPLGRHDAIYIPRDSNVQVSTKSTADLAEFSCEERNNILCRSCVTPI